MIFYEYMILLNLQGYMAQEIDLFYGFKDVLLDVKDAGIKKHGIQKRVSI
tara:strand:- start:358 stop:507 length:150 start_codon:yes stop_codon:yes gene_type:complete